MAFSCGLDTNNISHFSQTLSTAATKSTYSLKYQKCSSIKIRLKLSKLAIFRLLEKYSSYNYLEDFEVNYKFIPKPAISAL